MHAAASGCQAAKSRSSESTYPLALAHLQVLMLAMGVATAKENPALWPLAAGPLASFILSVRLCLCVHHQLNFLAWSNARLVLLFTCIWACKVPGVICCGDVVKPLVKEGTHGSCLGACRPFPTRSRPCS